LSRVIAVHGIFNTHSGERSMAENWVPALLDGVTRASGDGRLAPSDVDCVFYGDVFRPAGRMLGAPATPGGPDVSDPDEVALLKAWWDEAARTDPGVPPPGEPTLGVRTGVQAALAALACSRYLAGPGERLLVHWLQQVRRYFADEECRATIQKRFAGRVGPETEVVVAHSLGSVVAYEALCAHPEWNVGMFVTLGSPLGIRNVVLDRLRPAPVRLRGHWPESVRGWTNIADANDFVALVKRLSGPFGDGVVDVAVANGVRAHEVRRYLTAEQTGRAVLAGLRR
jgi:hypothetical protein